MAKASEIYKNNIFYRTNLWYKYIMPSREAPQSRPEVRTRIYRPLERGSLHTVAEWQDFLARNGIKFQLMNIPILPILNSIHELSSTEWDSVLDSPPSTASEQMTMEVYGYKIDPSGLALTALSLVLVPTDSRHDQRHNPYLDEVTHYANRYKNATGNNAVIPDSALVIGQFATHDRKIRFNTANELLEQIGGTTLLFDLPRTTQRL